jgi:hypothetical protein
MHTDTLTLRRDQRRIATTESDVRIDFGCARLTAAVWSPI